MSRGPAPGRGVHRERYTVEVQASPDANAAIARRQLALLAKVSRLLATSWDVDATASTIAQLAVPALADWCSVEILEDGGAIVRKTFHNRPSERYPEIPVSAWPDLA